MIESLVGHADRVARGHGALVLVSGEAGAGKSSLVEEFLTRLEGRYPDLRTARGWCDGLFTPTPLGPLFDIAEDLGGEPWQLCRSGADRDTLFPALLRAAGSHEPFTVVVIEDLHWADEASVDLMRFWSRRLRDARVLLLVTCRDDQLAADHPARIALGEFAGQRWSERLRLESLSVAAVARMAAHSSVDPAALYRLTGGNPFFVTEVLRSGTDRIPVSARDAVLARAAVLDAEARALLDVAARVGSSVDLDVLFEATEAAPESLDALISSGLLVDEAAGLHFRHELTRLAIEQATPAHRAVDIHRRILAALHKHGSSDHAALAHHAEAAGDTAAVLEHAVRAAERAVELASHREAAAQYQRALRTADALPAAGRAELLDAAGREHSLIDQWEKVADTATEAEALWRATGDRLRQASSLRLLSSAFTNLCRGAEADAAAQQAVTALEPLGPTPEFARALAYLARQRMLTDHNDDAVRLAERALALAERLGAHDVRSDALNTWGCAVRHDVDRARPYLHAALDVALEHGLDEQAARAYNNLHSSLCDARRYEEARPYYEAGEAHCTAHEIDTFGRCLRGGRAYALLETGRWNEAAALARPRADEAGISPANRISLTLTLGALQFRRSEDDGRLQQIDEMVATADGGGEPQWIIKARLLRAEAHWLAGRTDDARADALRAAAVSDTSDPWAAGAAAAWLRRVGLTRPTRADLALPYRWELAGNRGAAVAWWIDAGCRYEAAVVLTASGDEGPLRQALAIFDDLGAVAASRFARKLLRARGARLVPAGPRAATRAHPLGLTRREREVLSLIRTGCTNAQIADQLVIAVKTVDHHVSAILTKFDLPNRAAVAAHAERLGLPDVS